MQKIWNKLQSGLQQYCQKNGFNKVILGLSGGLDSAITAVLAADSLGGQNVTAIMMTAKHTSALSLNIARQIANLNHLDYHEINIESLVANETSFLTQIFNNTPKSIVLENITARTRGKILMAWSNQFGGLVLACGNKSEASTGYCTLYGDTCGGLMPIGNLYKTEVFALSRWRNQQSFVLPEEVITRAPSAELADNQIDENSLPPYKVLDEILHLYIDKGKTFDEIQSAGFSPEIIRKTIHLYNTSAFKRQQMAPALEI